MLSVFDSKTRQKLVSYIRSNNDFVCQHKSLYIPPITNWTAFTYIPTYMIYLVMIATSKAGVDLLNNFKTTSKKVTYKKSLFTIK